MNKRFLDLLAALAGVLTIIAGMSYDKDILQLLKPEWTPYITYASAIATVLLKVLAYFAPPTPSPTPPNPTNKPQ
jgi:predicted acyltransferase